ncbi:MAG TPA: hypothetical protein VK190_04740 [Pseudoneobacillus sp.]|nr:hypothetical protein [Pseudoneobacillus sp.]
MDHSRYCVLLYPISENENPYPTNAEVVWCDNMSEVRQTALGYKGEADVIECQKVMRYLEEVDLNV